MPRLDLRGRFERHRKEPRFVAAGLGLLLSLFTIVYYLIQRGRDLPGALVTNKVLLFAIRSANVVLILVAVFVLARILLRLWLDRRQRVLGARFKTKLIATYVGLSLVPVMLLFFYANELLQGSIDRWFSGSLRTVLEQSSAVAQALQTEVGERNYREAVRAARQLGGLDPDAAADRRTIEQRLDRARAESGVDFLGLYLETDFLHAVVDPRSGLNDLPEVGRQLLLEAIDSGRAGRIILPGGVRGRLVLSAAAGPIENRRRLVVVAGTLLDPLTSGRSEELIQAFQSYRQLEVQKRDFALSYRLMFVLVTLLILLASAWIGLFLVRRLMLPIQELAEATRRISSGDLDHRVEVAADEEMAAVVESFNRMTGELKRNREEIERSQSELVEANRGLAEERALVSAILENLAAGVIAIEAGGRVLSANGAALSLLRQRESDLVGRPLTEAWADEERLRLADLVAAPAPRAHEGTELALVLGGERRTFEVKRSELRDATGRVTGQIVVLEDLSDLIKAQKLAAWTEAARRIAHEIKNPLTPIRLAAERLRVRHREGDPAIGALLEESVDVIVREVATMQALVDEFSRYARMPGPQLAPAPLAALVADVVALYRDVKPGVVIETDVAPGVGEIWIDREQIRGVLINLLDNAVEASDAPSVVRLSITRRVDKVAIEVADQGSGIAPEDRDKLFLPFFSRKRRGTGMGLAIVQRIVADHNGVIRVGDNSPRGTVFTIEIPAR
jgi:two-component system nitrogen regulation sensor histidine kinase NtrY